MSTRPALVHTKRALEEYDAGLPARSAMLDKARTDAQYKKWVKAEDEAQDKVRRAFFEDTKDRNSLDKCRLVGLSQLRRWCAK